MGLLVLATGCLANRGTTTDLPRNRPYPVPHPPDGLTMAREVDTRLENRLRTSLSKLDPFKNWTVFGIPMF